MYPIMHVLLLHMLCLVFSNELVFSASESEANNPVFNLDHTAMEKNIAAIFNKVAHSSATTKRSVPAYEAQISQSTTHSTSPAPAITSITSSILPHTVFPKATHNPLLHEIPSYAPPSRALITPPLPPEYSNPFADKPTLRGTNVDAHPSIRRPVPPPSLTPAHERIPIKPPDLIEETTKSVGKEVSLKNKMHDFVVKDSFEMSDREKDLNDTIDFVPSLHFTSISRILSGSNGRKQDIPEILLKSIPTKSSSNFPSPVSANEKSSTVPINESIDKMFHTSTSSSVLTLPDKKSEKKDKITDNYYNSKKSNEPYRNVNTVNNERLPHPQPQPTAKPSRVPDINKNDRNYIPPLDSTWTIAWSFHVYLTATTFTLIALYSVFKIVRFNNATNLLTQSYFLTIHLLLTVICTLRCFYLFYEEYNFRQSLPETLSNILELLPSSLLAASFAALILYMSRSSTVPSLYQNKFLSPLILIFAFTTYVTICILLHISGHVLSYPDDSKILPLICQCIYIIICITLGLCYMYVYRVIKYQLQINGTKSVNNHVSPDYTTSTLTTAITTTIATALLFILMGFIQLYKIFGVPERRPQPNSWLWLGWTFSVRVVELSVCGLLAWVASLSQYQLREKQIQQHVHSGFALFPCGSSTSTENMDDALYPAICSTNQAIQNYTIRTGKQVYDDSFPLNTLPEHHNISSTFERHGTRKSGTATRFTQDVQDDSLDRRRGDTQTLYTSSIRNKHSTVPQNVHEQSSASGSTMLVAEDGFVRFRNLGSEEDDLSDPQSVIGYSNGRRNSVTCNDRCNTNQTTLITQIPQGYQQNSLPHLHLSLHRNQHQIYNNT